MGLASGSSLGPYEILSPIGAGGMGEVYRARDSRLGRDVALKVLPELFAADAERLARFRREAQTLAALNHPNIAQIHGLEKTDSGAVALVMEFVDGEDLAQLLKRGPIPIDEALPIARQIAEALDAAHEQGIVHRDLKPANIKLRPDGTVKVLDFGLAKAIDPVASGVENSPTITSPAMTMRGVILGTAAYMAPEQAKGKPVDRRADIWAFGCVLYEALAGVRAFDGEDVTEILGAIVKTDPDWSRLPPGTPATVRTLLARCLTKDRAQRWRSMGDARLQIDDALSGQAGPGQRSTAGRWKWLAPAFLVAGIATGAAVTAMWPAADTTRSAPTLRASLAMPSGMNVRRFYLAPDGTRMVVIASSDLAGLPAQVYSRKFDDYAFTLVGGTDRARILAFSPDSQWLAVVVRSKDAAGEQLIKVPVDGSSPPVMLANWAPTWDSDSLTWLQNGDLLTAETEGTRVHRIPGSGGPAAAPVSVEASATWDFDALGRELTAGRGGVFIATSSFGARGYQVNVALLDPTTGRVTPVIEDANDPSYVDSGHLLFSRGDTLLAARFDPNLGTVTGGPIALLSGMHAFAGPADVDYSRSGALAYVQAGQLPVERHLVVIDPAGKVTPFVPEGGRLDLLPALEPGGVRALVTQVRADATYEVVIADKARGTLRKWATDPGADVYGAIWSPDGAWVAYTRDGLTADDGVYLRRADGSGTPMRAWSKSASEFMFPNAWLPDSTGVIVNLSKGDQTDLHLLPLPVNGKMLAPQRLRSSALKKRDGAISANGRIVSYSSTESGREEVYVAPLDNGQLGIARQVSDGGCGRSRWIGQRLYFCAVPGKLMAVDVAPAPGLLISVPKEVVDLAALRVESDNWDMMPDGKVLAIQRHAGEDTLSSVNVIFNFGGELRARLLAGAPK